MDKCPGYDKGGGEFGVGLWAWALGNSTLGELVGTYILGWQV